MSRQRLSAVARGVAFEKRALVALRGLNMALERVGGREDGGIDLQGWWFLPRPITHETADHNMSQFIETDSLMRIRVLAQCKAESKKMGPNYVREMEGVLSRHRYLHNGYNMQSGNSGIQSSGNHNSRSNGEGVDGSERIEGETVTPSPLDLGATPATIALLVSQSAFTKSTLLRALSSHIPFLLVHLPSQDTAPSAPVLNQVCGKVLDDDDTGAEPLTATRSIDLSPNSGSNSPSPSNISLFTGSAIWNLALSGASGPSGQGLLQGAYDLRWERDLVTGSGRPALWMVHDRKRVGRCIPSGL